MPIKIKRTTSKTEKRLSSKPVKKIKPVKTTGKKLAKNTKSKPVTKQKRIPKKPKKLVISKTKSNNELSSVYESIPINISPENLVVGCSSSSEDLPLDGVLPEHRELKTVFEMDNIGDPLIGTPTKVRKELDALAIRLQRRPRDQAAFLKIVCYMHKYILGLVFKKYNYVRGHDDKDIYQEALIALFRKAVPSFRKGKGMSFLNFAKMCINRHLITILNASRNRCKDMPLNTSVSLDHSPLEHAEDGDDACTLSNIIPDTVHGKPPFTDLTRSETFNTTLNALTSMLSPFEQTVLTEYLKDKSYRDASRSVSKICGKKCNERSIDNALLRIRKKAMTLKNELGEDALPLVFGNVES